jgi:hypothetical protein
VVERHAGRLARAGREDSASGAEYVWPRARVARWPRVVAGEVLRRAARDVTGGRGDDRRGLAAASRVIAATRDGSTHARRFEWRGVEVRVTSREVTLRAVAGAATPARRGRRARPPA